MNLPDIHVNETVPVLIDILRDIPYIDFDHCLAWDGKFVASYVNIYLFTKSFWVDWALPDQLAFATVSALLRIASSHPEHREAATCAISGFVSCIVKMLKDGGCKFTFAVAIPVSSDEPPCSCRYSFSICTFLPWTLSSHHIHPFPVVC